MQSGPSLAVIGRLRTPFRDRFGIPRQAGLVDLPGRIEMAPPYDQRAFFEGLEEVSHLWVTFLFHAVQAKGWKGRVRPPRLGGNRRLGVFATRSPFRPNHLGLSVLRLKSIEAKGGGGVSLNVSGVDMLDGTPVVDIKPYIPYADAIPEASGGFASEAPAQRLQVVFTPQAEHQRAQLGLADEIVEALARLIALDPRPAYTAGNDEGREYGLSLYDWNVRWQVYDRRRLALVTAVTPTVSEGNLP